MEADQEAVFRRLTMMTHQGSCGRQMLGGMGSLDMSRYLPASVYGEVSVCVCLHLSVHP